MTDQHDDLPLVKVRDLRLPYWRFANVVERARRETLREHPEYPNIHVIAMSVDASQVDSEADLYRTDPWGEFYRPAGPIVIYQLAYESMGDQENYYRQIKAVLRHEYEHALGDDHDEVIYARVARRVA